MNAHGAKSLYLYECKCCNYNTYKKGDYGRHIQTGKHKNNELLINISEKTAPKSYICECGKNYKHNQSLYNHKKICDFILQMDRVKNIYLQDYCSETYDILQ